MGERFIRGDGQQATVRLGNGMSLTYLTQEGFEQKAQGLLASGRFTREQIQAARIKRDAQEFEANRALALENYDATANTTGRAGSFLMNLGNSQALNAALPAVSALTAPITAAMRPGDISLGEAAELNYARGKSILGARPGAQIAGQVAGAVMPGPANAVMGAATRMASSPLARIAAGTAGRTGVSSLAQIGAAVAGNVSGTVAGSTDIGFDVLAGDRSLEDAANALLGRAAFAGAFGAVTGALTSPFRVKASAELKGLFERMRLHGVEPPPDVGRDPRGMTSWVLEVLRNSPVGRVEAGKWLENNFYKPMEGALKGLERRAGADDLATSARTAGASLSARIAGRGGSVQDDLTRLGQEALEGPGGSKIVSEDARKGIGLAIGALEKRAARMMTEEPRSTRIAAILGRYKKALSETNEQLPLRALEPIRQQLRSVADFGDDLMRSGQASRRDVREAKVLYAAVSKAMKSSSDEVSVAFAEMQRLHRFAEALKPVAKVVNEQGEIQGARAFFQSGKALNRWRQVEQSGDTVMMQKLRGVYLADFLDEVAVNAVEEGSKTERIVRGQIMRDLFSGKRANGRFNQTLFDRVLGPQMREELTDLGDASVHIMRRTGRAEGSHTFGRFMGVELLGQMSQNIDDAAGMASGAGAKAGFFTRNLGVVGSYLFAKSVFNGQMGQRLIRLATGGEATPGIAPFMRGRGALPIPAPAIATRAAPSLIEQIGGIAAPQFQENKP